jgi:hypothetical protein
MNPILKIFAENLGIPNLSVSDSRKSPRLERKPQFDRLESNNSEAESNNSNKYGIQFNDGSNSYTNTVPRTSSLLNDESQMDSNLLGAPNNMAFKMRRSLRDTLKVCDYYIFTIVINFLINLNI